MFIHRATQVGPIRTFEVFARNLDPMLDRFEVVLDSTTVNENPELDTLIPFSKLLRTNHLILRGEYEKIFLAIYGKLLSHEDTSLLVSRQFEVSQPMRREDNITPLLSKEEEEILEQAEASLAEPEPASLESMIDIKGISLSDTTFTAKLQIKSTAFTSSTNKNPLGHCTQLRDFIGTIEIVHLFITLSF